MPKVNLRLTEEEHAQLEAWAKDGHRSLQKEIIFRLFSDFPSHVATAVSHAERKATEEVRAATGRDDLVATFETEPVTASVNPDDHFKPDFGKKLK